MSLSLLVDQTSCKFILSFKLSHALYICPVSVISVIWLKKKVSCVWMSDPLLLKKYIFKIYIVFVFLYYCSTHFSVARYFLPEPSASCVSVCVMFRMSSGSFLNAALFGAENCITALAWKQRRVRACSRLSLPFVLREGNFIFHP